MCPVEMVKGVFWVEAAGLAVKEAKMPKSRLTDGSSVARRESPQLWQGNQVGKRH